ncbi:hypothetical protein SEA_BLAB_73 [Microbacterium phage Blab]|nr:hypothetical protein SEA_BLAB_73 [Microbacterium phage Blab]
MSTALTPYDRGVRGEPKVWPHVTRSELATLAPIALELEEDRFGRVDFDDDEGATLVTVWIELGETGEHVVHIQEHTTEVMVKVHNG